MGLQGEGTEGFKRKISNIVRLKFHLAKLRPRCRRRSHSNGRGSLERRGSASSLAAGEGWGAAPTRFWRISCWCCLALLYSRTPMITRTVPMAETLVILFPKTMMLSQMDKACFTVLATLGKDRKTGGDRENGE